MSPEVVELVDPARYLACSEINEHFSGSRHTDANHLVYLSLIGRCRRGCSTTACPSSSGCPLPVASGTEPKVFDSVEYKRRFLANSVRWARHAELSARQDLLPDDDASERAASTPSPERVAVGVDVLEQMLERRRSRSVEDDKAVLGRAKEIDRSREVAERLLVGLLGILTEDGPNVQGAKLLESGKDACERKRRERAFDGARRLLSDDGRAVGLEDVAAGVIEEFLPVGH